MKRVFKPRKSSFCGLVAIAMFCLVSERACGTDPHPNVAQLLRAATQDCVQAFSTGTAQFFIKKEGIVDENIVDGFAEQTAADLRASLSSQGCTAQPTLLNEIAGLPETWKPKIRERLNNRSISPPAVPTLAETCPNESRESFIGDLHQYCRRHVNSDALCSADATAHSSTAIQRFAWQNSSEHRIFTSYCAVQISQIFFQLDVEFRSKFASSANYQNYYERLTSQCGGLGSTSKTLAAGLNALANYQQLLERERQVLSRNFEAAQNYFHNIPDEQSTANSAAFLARDCAGKIMQKLINGVVPADPGAQKITRGAQAINCSTQSSSLVGCEDAIHQLVQNLNDVQKNIGIVANNAEALDRSFASAYGGFWPDTAGSPNNAPPAASHLISSLPGSTINRASRTGDLTTPKTPTPFPNKSGSGFSTVENPAGLNTAKENELPTNPESAVAIETIEQTADIKVNPSDSKLISSAVPDAGKSLAGTSIDEVFDGGAEAAVEKNKPSDKQEKTSGFGDSGKANLQAAAAAKAGTLLSMKNDPILYGEGGGAKPVKVSGADADESIDKMLAELMGAAKGGAGASAATGSTNKVSSFRRNPSRALASVGDPSEQDIEVSLFQRNYEKMQDALATGKLTSGQSSKLY